MQIDLEDELSYLEGVKDNLVEKQKKWREARHYLEEFELKIRRIGYPMIVKQSNAQKMQLEFEHSVAQHDGNWTTWLGLKKKFDDAEGALEEATLDWEYCKERCKLLGILKDDNVE